MKFNKKQIERYSRQIILKKIGPVGQKKLLGSSVLIVGAGGLGSPIAIYLAGLGIGKIGILVILSRFPKVKEMRWLSLMLR